MNVKEFEGRNEEEAINRAIESLGLNRDEIDVEIVQSRKPPLLFGGGKVKIRVHLEEDRRKPPGALSPQNEFEARVVEFVAGMLQRAGLDAQVRIAFREERKLGLDVRTEDSAILIGKRGQTLEAVQLLVNAAAGRLGPQAVRVVVDTQNYRQRREMSLIRLAEQTAEQVRRTRTSRLLEAMNPFERRLIHTTLSGVSDIETQSEGEGLYKRIRVNYRGKA